MNDLLQKHGCANVFHVPEGLQELMADISREVLRKQPNKICDFIANYISALLITREHGVLAVKLLDDLCDCKPTVSEHLMNIGMERGEAEVLAQIIKEVIESVELVEGREKVREQEILKKILKRKHLDEVTMSQVCEIARNAYRDYWYRKHLLEETMRVSPEEPWEIAAQHTLELYKKTKPSFNELTRATVRIQAAYKGFHTRRKLLGSRKPKKVPTPKLDLPGPPVDIAESREIDLGPVLDIKDKVKVEDVEGMFPKPDKNALGYDHTKTLTIAPDKQIESHKTQPDSEQKDKKTAFQADVPVMLAVTSSKRIPESDPEPDPELDPDTFDFDSPHTISFAPKPVSLPVEELLEDVQGYSSSSPTSDVTSEPLSAPVSEPATDVEDLATDNE